MFDVKNFCISEFYLFCTIIYKHIYAFLLSSQAKYDIIEILQI